MSSTIGQLVYSFFMNHLNLAKGLRPSSIATYRDGIRLFLCFVADDVRCKISKLRSQHLTAQRVLRFLRYLEERRGNQIRTRNHRLVIVRAFFEYLAGREPEVIAEAEKVARIPTKRTQPPATHFLERDEIDALFAAIQTSGSCAERDFALLLFLYNTGARVQEAADLRVGSLDLDAQPRVHLHGKGDKWRICPLWQRTAERLQRLIEPRRKAPDAPVFVSQRGRPLTRSGIYKIVRRRAGHLDGDSDARGPHRRVTPHVMRHTTAVHLLEAGVEVNVIRGWLGHAKLETTNRYAELSRRTKEAALLACDVPPAVGALPRQPPWSNDTRLLDWLDSL